LIRPKKVLPTFSSSLLIWVTAGTAIGCSPQSTHPPKPWPDVRDRPDRVAKPGEGIRESSRSLFSSPTILPECPDNSFHPSRSVPQHQWAQGSISHARCPFRVRPPSGSTSRARTAKSWTLIRPRYVRLHPNHVCRHQFPVCIQEEYYDLFQYLPLPQPPSPHGAGLGVGYLQDDQYYLQFPNVNLASVTNYLPPPQTSHRPLVIPPLPPPSSSPMWVSIPPFVVLWCSLIYIS